ncbi:Inner membrane metabolite transport protein YhjE [Serratia rubidaea]|nr:Inner membrane metabolite transport protein YhjE [Serratia rubidaea]
MLVASLIGTAIEFFDFYIYATAAVLVFPHIFFPQGDPTTATLQSLATFAVAFVARPIGSALFGHFGDRVGRKATLVASLLTMGISTVLIGLLPSYETIGVFAPLLLALARFGQGLGLGGEWGGAALLATENAPPRKRALYGSFPQLGAPIGFFFANGTFLLLSWLLTDQQFMAWGWRLPFILSAVLVLIGLYVRVSLHETPVFAKAVKAGKQVKIPLGTLLSKHLKVTILGTFIMLATYTLFYLMTVYSMTYGTAAQPLGLGYSRESFLWMLMLAVIGFGVMVPIAGLLADAYGRRRTMVVITLLMIGFAFLFPTMLGSGNQALVMAFLLCGLSIMGLTFGPMGALLPELFPTEVRYTGASFSYNVASILGASVAPYIATWLNANYGLFYVGMYLAAMATLTLIALLLMKETRHQSL